MLPSTAMCAVSTWKSIVKQVVVKSGFEGQALLSFGNIYYFVNHQVHDEFHSLITALQSSNSYWSNNDQAIESQRDWPTFPRSHSCIVADPSTGCLASVWALHNILSHLHDGSRPVVPVRGNTRSFDLFCVQTKSHLVYHKCQWVWYAWCSLSCWLDETWKPVCGFLAFFTISNSLVPGYRISVLSYFWFCMAPDHFPSFLPSFLSLSVLVHMLMYVNIGVCVHKSQWLMLGILFKSSPCCFWGKSLFLTNFSAWGSAWLDGWQVPGISLPLFLQFWGHRCRVSVPRFTRVLDIQT